MKKSRKLDASGNFVWAKKIGGIFADTGNSIAVDGTGNVYTTGYFFGTVDFDPGAGTFNLTSAGYPTGWDDIFISKLDASGNFVWAKKIGGTNVDRGESIAVDANGNVYTTGIFKETADFDPGVGTFNLTSAGNYDIFISKLNATGNFVWAKNVGGTSGDEGYSIAVDGTGNVYTTGIFQGTADFDPEVGTFNLTSAGLKDIFIYRSDASGNFVWAINIGGTNYDVGNSIAVDGTGNVYSTGCFSGTADFDPEGGTFNLTSTGLNDIFVHKMQCTGTYSTLKEFGQNFKIYPNPFSENTTIEFDNPSISTYLLTIFNVAGKEVWKQTISGSTVVINSGTWEEGYYFVEVQNGNVRFMAPLVVMRR